MKLRRLREGEVLDDGITLVRGGELEPDVLRADARRYHAVYGGYGISVFAARGATVDELAQQLRLEPAGRSPRHYTVGFDDIEQGVTALAGCAHQVVPNRYHDA